MQSRPSESGTGITIFTIGTSKKPAKEFFPLLRRAGVRKVIDVRLSNESQLAGFSKREDLRYFLATILGVPYVHMSDLAPTQEMLKAYRKKELGWSEYERLFPQLLEERNAITLLKRSDTDGVCMLCTEPTPDRCHRRLVAEYLQAKWTGVCVTHL